MLTCNLSTVRILAKKASLPCMFVLVGTCLFKAVTHTSTTSIGSSPYYYKEGSGSSSSSSSLRALEVEEENSVVVPPIVITGDGFDTALRRMYNHQIHLCDGNSILGQVCSENSDCLYDTSCLPVALDPFHIRKLFPSDMYNVENDWFDSWSYSFTSEEIIAGPSASDPRVTFFGNQEHMEQTSDHHVLVFDGTQSTDIMDSVFGMIIASNYPKTKGFDNVEFTTYVKPEHLSKETQQLVSLWARANNAIEGHFNCNSLLGYVAMWNMLTGEIKFQKHYGGNVATDFVVSSIRHVPDSSSNESKWYGIKFVVSTLPNSQDVHLQLYMDDTEGMNGGVWTLMHSFVDRPNEWMADEGERGHTSSYASEHDDGCDTAELTPDGTPKLGPTHGCVLEYMGHTRVSFKNVSVRNILKKVESFCNNHPNLVIPCTSDSDCTDGGVCHEYGLDRFGITKIYHNSFDKETSQYLDWTSTWDVPYINKELTALVSPGNQDPYDSRTAHRGIGSISFQPDGIIHMREQSRLFITKPMKYDVLGWDNVEFTAYGKILQDGVSGFDELSPTSGLEMVVRSNYDSHNGCNAASYVARIHRKTGQASFQKIYFDHLEKGRIETTSRRSEPLSQTNGGLPKDVWIGMKFVVYTYTQVDEDNTIGHEAVQLDLYVDMTGGKYGGDWQLVHTTVDYPGTWMASYTSETQHKVSDVCHPDMLSDGDTVLGPRKDCFLMVNGTPDTIVAWKRHLYVLLHLIHHMHRHRKRHKT